MVGERIVPGADLRSLKEKLADPKKQSTRSQRLDIQTSFKNGGLSSAGTALGFRDGEAVAVTAIEHHGVKNK